MTHCKLQLVQHWHHIMCMRKHIAKDLNSGIQRTGVSTMMPVYDFLAENKMAVFPHPPSPDLAPYNCLHAFTRTLHNWREEEVVISLFFKLKCKKDFPSFKQWILHILQTVVHSLVLLHKVLKILLCRRQHWLEGKWWFCCREIQLVRKVCDNTRYT
jgi:hypothetical protein